MTGSELLGAPGGLVSRTRVLVVDDEEAQRHFLRRALRRRGFDPVEAADAKNALAALSADAPACVLLDLRLGPDDGLDVLAAIRARPAAPPVILMTASAERLDALRTRQAGAVDYLRKPFTGDRVADAVARAMAGARVGATDAAAPDLPGRFGALIGRSSAMRTAFQRLARAGADTRPVLLLGETGTGKELAAWQLHHRGVRATGPFVPVLCSAIARERLIDTLFGGAGTDPPAACVQRARGGTLFLDEVWCLPHEVQHRLLTRLRRPEADAPRCIAASSRDLRGAGGRPRFSRALARRLGGVTVHLPPLRERPDDVPLLAQYFLERERATGPAARWTPAAVAVLRRYHWPGNVRELANVVERVALRARGAELDARHLPAYLLAPDPLGSLSRHRALRRTEAAPSATATPDRVAH